MDYGPRAIRSFLSSTVWENETLPELLLAFCISHDFPSPLHSRSSIGCNFRGDPQTYVGYFENYHDVFYCLEQ